MKYKLTETNGSPCIAVSAEATDQWIGVAFTRKADAEYLYCGEVKLKSTGKRVGLRLRLADKPELMELISQLEASNAAHEARQSRIVKIYLSSRGWGDYSPVEWIGDITRPDAEIIVECQHMIETGHDVDKNLSDAEIKEKITAAREAWETAPARKAAREQAEKEDIQNKIDSGYCFYCESWCYGDCGHYTPKPRI